MYGQCPMRLRNFCVRWLLDYRQHQSSKPAFSGSGRSAPRLLLMLTRVEHPAYAWILHLQGPAHYPHGDVFILISSAITDRPWMHLVGVFPPSAFGLRRALNAHGPTTGNQLIGTIQAHHPHWCLPFRVCMAACYGTVSLYMTWVREP
jgi:hypothetical protein